jgi:hypothetical protein
VQQVLDELKIEHKVEDIESHLLSEARGLEYDAAAQRKCF